jgi:hypothetical protein
MQMAVVCCKKYPVSRELYMVLILIQVQETER